MRKYKNTYDLTGPYGIGYTAKNEPFWFDLDDYDLIKSHTWSYDNNGYLNTTIRKNNKSKRLLFHHLVMPNVPDDMMVDHKTHPTGLNNHNFDNRKQNLRIVTRAQNNQNRAMRRDNTSGYTGIHQTKSGRWEASINHNKQTYSKTFDTLDEAIAWRRQKEIELHQDYAYSAHN